jgi:hypothetical protein
MIEMRTFFPISESLPGCFASIFMSRMIGNWRDNDEERIRKKDKR